METYVIQIWVPDPGQAAGAPDGIRGVARHVATGTSVTFVGSDELLDFIRSGTATATDGEAAPAPSRKPS